MGASTVGYWIRTESLGRGDLRLYYRPVLPADRDPAPPRALSSALHARCGSDRRARVVSGAKGAESCDGTMYRALGFVSGHTLKHLLATVGAPWLARMLLLRQPFAVQTAGTAA